MDIQILKEFLELSYTLNYYQTASKIFISQSTLSKHIKLLESELGQELFFRNRQTVELTPIGKEVQLQVKTIIGHYDQLINLTRHSRESARGTLRVGLFPSPHIRRVCSIAIKLFSELYPDITVAPIVQEPLNLSTAIQNEQLDFCITLKYPSTFIPHNLLFQKLYNVELCAGVNRSHPLSDKTSVTTEELRKYPLILPDHRYYPSFAEYVKSNLLINEQNAHIIYDYSKMEDSVTMVEAGSGISIWISELQSLQSDSLSIIPIYTDREPIEIGVYRKRGIDTIHFQTFLDFLIKASDTLPLD